MYKYLILFFILFFSSCSQAVTTNQKKVFVSSLAEKGWYEKNPLLLKKQISSFLESIKNEQYQNIKALILPHAGFRFSGRIAAHAIKQISNKRYKRVIILGPSHHVYMENKLSVPKQTHYKTPLGEVELDLSFIKELILSSYVHYNELAHINEHSVQIEIPFLQYVLDDFKIVPIVVGKINFKHVRKIAQLIKSKIDNNTLVVVSSDFTHYGKRFGYVPFATEIKNKLQKLDLNAWKLIKEKKIKEYYDYLKQTNITICGKYPIAILLSMLNDNSKAIIQKYDTSGNILNDYSNSVSYLSAIFTGSWNNNKENKGVSFMKQSLTQTEKYNLLNLAKETLTYYLKNGTQPSSDDFNIEITDGMKQIMGAFVTLHANGDLRGCIGEIFPRRELYKAVMDHAVNSAVNDYRFSKVTLKEFESLDFEISALTAPSTVESYNDIILGKHGIVLKKQGKSAVFLPQVATEQKWDLETTLSHLSIKAGLSHDDWKAGSQFLVFEAIVFSE